MPYTTLFVTIRNSTNNVGQNYPKDIAVPIIKNCQNKYHHYWYITKEEDVLFSTVKKNRWDKSDVKSEMRKPLKNYFMHQDNSWVKSDMLLNENVYYIIFPHLLETNNERFFKSIFLILKYFFTESRHPPSFLLSSLLFSLAS